MKAIIILIFFLGISVKSQVVVNQNLIIQLTKNQTARMTSNKNFLKSYEKQQELYNEINNKIIQVVSIQEYIYNKLTNVNEALLQGKKIKYIYQYLGKIANNLNELQKLTLKQPEYAILYYKNYEYITKEIISIKKELNEEILRENKDYLMDPMDREVLITKIYNKVRRTNGHIITIINALKVAKKTPYIDQIPILNTYVNLDKHIVKEILKKYNYLKN